MLTSSLLTKTKDVKAINFFLVYGLTHKTKNQKTNGIYGGTEGTQKIFFLLRAHAVAHCVRTQ